MTKYKLFWENHCHVETFPQDYMRKCFINKLKLRNQCSFIFLLLSFFAFFFTLFALFLMNQTKLINENIFAISSFSFFLCLFSVHQWKIIGEIFFQSNVKVDVLDRVAGKLKRTKEKRIKIKSQIPDIWN